MSGADFANTTGHAGNMGSMPPANIDTPAAEWSDKVLAAVHAPTAHTGGYAEASGPVQGVPATSSGIGGASSGITSGINTSGISSSAPADKDLAGLQHSVNLPKVDPAPFPNDSSITSGLAGLSVNPSSSSFAPVTGGGLATSPNVPQGVQTNSLTGQPHSEGLTRAELNARKAEVATGHKLEELTPREQAAAQLGQLGALHPPAANLSNTGELTPGKELPGGWGPVTPIPAAGTSTTHPTTSIYEDVQHAVQNLGNAAYSAVPAGLKERVQNLQQTSPSKTAGGLLDQAKGLLNSVSQSANHSDPATIAKTDQQRVPGTVGAQGGLVAQARGFVHEIAEVLKGEDHLGHNTMPVTAPVIGGMGGIAPVTSGVVGGPSHATSASSSGAHTGGVGDLPGSSRETGVAVLPEERAHPDPLNESKGGLTGASTSTSAVPTSSSGPAHETAVVAKSNDIRDSALTGSSAPAVNSGAGSSSAIPASSLVSGGPASSQQTTSSAPASHGQLGLAPPLGTFVDATPTTSGFKDKTEHGLPQVASIGTAIDAHPVKEIPVGKAAGDISTSSATPSVKPISAVDPRMSAERADSTTSVTAIRHGEPGNLHKSTNVPAVIGEAPTSTGGSKDLPPVPPTKSNNFDAVSRTPGHASAGVGSATASSPLAASSTIADKTTANSEPHPDVKSEYAAVGHGTIANPASATPAKEAPVTPSSATPASGHNRESSTSSSGKKSGFLAKVKAKLHHEK